MSKNMSIQQIIEQMKTTIQENPYRENDEKMIKRIREWIVEIIQIEAEQFGYGCIIAQVGENLEIADDEENNKTIRFFFDTSEQAKNEAYVDSKYGRIDFKMVFAEKFLKDFNYSPNLIFRIIYVVYHELQHVRQALMAKTGVSSFKNLIFAKELVMTSIEESKKDTFNKIYDANHNTFFIEEDANIAGKKATYTYFRDKRFI